MMLLETYWQNPAFILAVIAAIPIIIVGFFTYRSSRDMDETARKSNTDSGQAAWVAQVLTENRDLRDAMKACTLEMREIRVRVEAIELGKHDLELEVRKLTNELTRKDEEIKQLKTRIDELERTNGKAANGGVL